MIIHSNIPPVHEIWDRRMRRCVMPGSYNLTAEQWREKSSIDIAAASCYTVPIPYIIESTQPENNNSRRKC
jgi:hypothetical protein